MMLPVIALGATSARSDQGFLPFQIPPWISSNQSADPVALSDNETTPVRNSRRAREQSPKLLAPDDYKDLLTRIQPIIDNASPSSPLESMYSKRVVDSVKQFGYDIFQTSQNNAENQKSEMPSLPAGAVQDNFVLNFGDKLNIVFRGQRRENGIYSITSDGLLIVDDMAPVPAAGRTIGQVREALETMASDLHNTEVFVALDSVRQANVLVVGHARYPGSQTLTVFHTVLDALIQAGGIQKTGTLRQIKLVRDGRTQIIDLYGLLVYGSAGMDLSLRDGDRIMIPPIGPTVAITGGVKRPGIYEILPSLKGMRHKPEESSDKLSLQEALDLAGGLLSPGNNRFIRLDLTNDGRERTEDLSAPFVPVLGDGNILVVERADEQRTETVELTGHTRQPGIHALSRAPTLSALLSNARVLGPDIYTLIGVIERTDNQTLTRQFIDFPPQLVIAGEYDRKLQDGDVVSLFSRKQMMALQKQGNPGDETIKSEEGSADDLDDDHLALDPTIESFLRERSVYVRGAVRNPGPWPVSEGATLNSTIAVAGGLTLEANTANIEVTTALNGEGHQSNGRSGTERVMIDYQATDPDTVAIAPGDAIRINQKFRKTEGQSVMIAGEVYHPGKYDLLPGDTLGKLLERAGGTTDQAYPDGAIFSRDSDRRAEEARFRAAARELERAVAAASAGDGKKDNAPDAEQIAMARDLADELKNVEAVGRITVQADPSTLKAHPEQDILLEAGDRIYIPRRGLTVRVHGEVLSPATLQFREDKTPLDYIAEAGGMTYYADDERTFVLYPDGSAQPLLVSAWSHKAIFVPPGSTIVVPRDPKPFDFMTSARDFTQILSNLALTGIFLNDIKDSGN